MTDWLSKYTHISKVNYHDDRVEVCIHDYGQLHTFIQDFTKDYKLKSVYDYLKSEFDPTEQYRIKTTQGDTVILYLEDTPLLHAYKSAYQVLVHETLPIKGVLFFDWLVQHTTPLKSYTNKVILKGDRQFNQSIQLQSVRDLYEVMDVLPLTLQGSHIKVKQTNEVERYINQHHWRVGDRYYIKGKGAYYLPFTVEIEDDEFMRWLKGMVMTPGRLLEFYIRGNELDIDIKGKNDFMWFIGRVTQDLGTQDLLRQVITQFRVGRTYTFKHLQYTIHIKHAWVDHNIHYAESVYTLVTHYDFRVATHKSHLVMIYYQILEDSQYNPHTQGITLKGYLYAELGVSQELLVGKLQELGVDTYATKWDDVGDVLPITFTVGGIRINSPYKRIYNNQFKRGYYPSYYLRPIYQTPLKESYLNPYILNEGRPNQLSASVELLQLNDLEGQSKAIEGIIDQLELDFLVSDIDIKGTQPKDMSKLPLIERVKNLPHVRDVGYTEDSSRLEVHLMQTGGVITITLNQFTQDREVLYAIIKQVAQPITDPQLRDVLQLVLSVFEQSEWVKEFKEDEGYQTIWLNYLERVLTHAQLTMATGVGYQELLDILNTMPVVQKQESTDLSDLLGFSVSEDIGQPTTLEGTLEQDDDEQDDEGFSADDLIAGLNIDGFGLDLPNDSHLDKFVYEDTEDLGETDTQGTQIVRTSLGGLLTSLVSDDLGEPDEIDEPDEPDEIDEPDLLTNKAFDPMDLSNLI